MSSENTETPKTSVWIWLLIPILVFGIAVGLLMTHHHESQLYGATQETLIGCEASAEVNCDIVNTSSYSEFLSVPIAT